MQPLAPPCTMNQYFFRYRRRLQINAQNPASGSKMSIPGLLPNLLPASPNFHPMRRVSGETNMHGASSVPANVLPPAPLHPSGLPLPLHQSSEISPFRPSTEKISTLRPTIASQMSDALEEAGVMDDVQYVQGDGLDDISMFDPEKKSSVSIEDAQRSLSSEGSGGGGDVSALQESRRMSVSFAPTHKVKVQNIHQSFV